MSGSHLTLIVGDPVLADRQTRAIEAALRLDDPELIVLRLVGAEAGDADIADAAAPTLFGGSTLLVLTEADAITADAADPVVDLVADLPEHLRLVVCHSGAKNRGAAVLKAVQAAADEVVTVAAPGKAADRVEFVREEFAAAHRQITGEAAGALVDSVGSGIGELIAACAQLLSDTTGRVDVADVRQYYSGRAEVKGWEVADAAVEGRADAAIGRLRSALSSGTAEVLIVGSLASALRTLARAAALPRGVRSADAARELGVPPWKADIVRRQARAWSQRGLADAFLAVAQADAALKGDGDARTRSYALERAVAAVALARATD
jgi:DNA polymerase-3 subunit delta